MNIKRRFLLFLSVCTVIVSVPFLTCAQASQIYKKGDVRFPIEGNHWKKLDVDIVSRWINQAEGFNWNNGAEGLCRIDGAQLFLLWLLLLGLGAMLLFSKYRNARDKKEKTLELQKERIESELKALKTQMNPHFLFNTFNSINWYIIKDKSVEASKYLTKFAKLMRLILDNSEAEKITLAKELETLVLYTELEAVRFEGEFEYDFKIDDTIHPENFLMPPLIFQPFIENAIWHGLLHKETKGKISLQITEEEDHLRCRIEDNGIGRSAAMKIKARASNYRESSGIEITKNRILGINGSDKNAFEIIDLKNREGQALGTIVEILLPIEILSSNIVT